MDPVIMGIWIDSIVAVTAVAGVIVAARLGRKAVVVAKETVERTEKDYAGSRLDLVHEWQAAVTQIMAELKADLHIFWKEDQEVLLGSDPASATAGEVTKRRQEAEVAAHRDIYRLEGAAGRLAKAVGAARIVTGAGPVPAENISERVFEALFVYERSAMTLYLALVPEQKFPDPSAERKSFVDEFMFQLFQNTDMSDARRSAETWLTSRLESRGASKLTPKMVAIDFVELYAQRELDAAVERLTEPLLEVCVARTNAALSMRR